MILEWWHWAVLGIVLVVAELVMPAFVLVWFGLGALLVGVGLLVLPDMGLISQLLLWTVTSIAMVALWFKVFKPAHHKILFGRSSAQAVGEIGMLVSDVDSFQKGKVRFQKPLVGSDLWDCIADEAIKSGARVRVTGIEGSLLKVTRTGDKS